MIVVIFLKHSNRMRAFPSVKEMCRHLKDIRYYYFRQKRLSDHPTIYKEYAVYKLNYSEYFKVQNKRLKSADVRKTLSFTRPSRSKSKDKLNLE